MEEVVFSAGGVDKRREVATLADVGRRKKIVQTNHRISEGET